MRLERRSARPINTPVTGHGRRPDQEGDDPTCTRELARRELKTRLVLQIHDELLLEVPADETEEASALVRHVMENALALDVPLVVDARLGRTWLRAH